MKNYAAYYIALSKEGDEEIVNAFALEEYIELYRWLSDYVNNKPDLVNQAAANTTDITLLAIFKLMDFLKEHMDEATGNRDLVAPLQMKLPHLRVLANILRSDLPPYTPLVIRILQAG